ncbi:MAG: hypothetical protein HY044_02195 [Candidatus Woesebacteria bacterium]|nr:MAG: hypothetical protein HY044_02195 [Candidatus Woesebacteria bacterium]
MNLGLVSTRWDDEVMQILRAEFYGKYTEEEFLEMMRKDMENDSQSLINSSEIQRATDVFFVREEEIVVAILMLKYYKWALLGPQLFFEVLSDSQITTAIALKPFNQLVVSDGLHAGELAYFWVNPTREVRV